MIITESVLEEFKKTIFQKDFLTAKIMLKNSMLVDPTFMEFDSMLDYVKSRMDILELFDGGSLEQNSDKWDTKQMNEELGRLVENFSQERIDHLRRVVSKVLAEKIAGIKAQREKVSESSKSSTTYIDRSQNRGQKSNQTKQNMAVHKLADSADHIVLLRKKIIEEQAHKWKKQDIEEMEQEAYKILEAVDEYFRRKSTEKRG